LTLPATPKGRSRKMASVTPLLYQLVDQLNDGIDDARSNVSVQVSRETSGKNKRSTPFLHFVTNLPC